MGCTRVCPSCSKNKAYRPGTSTGALAPAAQHLSCICDAHISKEQTEPLLQLTHEVGYYRGVETRRQKVAFSLAPWGSGCGLAPETSLPLHPKHGFWKWSRVPAFLSNRSWKRCTGNNWDRNWSGLPGDKVLLSWSTPKELGQPRLGHSWSCTVEVTVGRSR